MIAQTAAVRDLLAERERQITEEGWSLSHDDQHSAGELTLAGVSYALNASEVLEGSIVSTSEPPLFWPWAPSFWKPKGARRDLVRAAALLIAEIEKIDRLTDKGVSP